MVTYATGFFVVCRKNCVIAPVRHKTKSTVQLTCFLTWSYIALHFHLCKFNSPFLPMDSTNSSIHFCFVVLLLCNKLCWHMEISYERNKRFLRNGWPRQKSRASASKHNLRSGGFFFFCFFGSRGKKITPE